MDYKKSILMLLLAGASSLMAMDVPTNSLPTFQTINNVTSQIGAIEQRIVTSFTSFMNSFLAILANKTTQAKELVNEMIRAVIELSQRLNPNKKITGLTEYDDTAIFTTIDQNLLDTLSIIVISKAKNVSQGKRTQTNSQVDAKQRAEVQKILNSFAAVMQNFFTIVQDPENKANVTHGIVGMIGNIIAAGNIIMNDTEQQEQPKTVQEIVASMDESTKQQILNLIQSRSQSVRIQSE